MKQFVAVFLLAMVFSGMLSCSHNTIEKPDQLIGKDKFVKMLTDIYIIQGMNLDVDNPQDSIKKITQTDLYYSILKKYSVADTVFIRSLIYYSSFPKNYEKMHVEIINKLNESQEKFRPKEKLQIKDE
jgi:hypothetical protein